MLSGFSKHGQHAERRMTEPGGPSVPSSSFVPDAQILSAQPQGGESRPRSYGPLAAFLYGMVFFWVAQFGAAVAIIIALRLSGWGQDRIVQWLEQAIIGQFMFILLAEAATVYGIYWALKRRDLGMRFIGWNRLQLRYVWLALAGFGVYFVSYIVVVVVMAQLVPSLNIEQEQQVGFQGASSAKDLALTAISLVILPPLAEEILFRGFLFTGFRTAWKFLPAAIVTSVLFAVGHLQFGSGAPLLWVAAIDTFVLSLVLCYMREKTGSLWPSIFIHAIKNGLAFSALFLLK